MRLTSFSINTWVVLSLATVSIIPVAVSSYQIATSRDAIIEQAQFTQLVSARAVAERIASYLEVIKQKAEFTVNNPNLYKDPKSTQAQEVLRGVLLSSKEILAIGVFSTVSSTPELIQLAKRREVLTDPILLSVSKKDPSVSLFTSGDDVLVRVQIVVTNLKFMIQVIARYAPINRILASVEESSSAKLVLFDRSSQKTATDTDSVSAYPANLIQQALSAHLSYGADRYSVANGTHTVAAFATVSNSPWIIFSKQPANEIEVAMREMRTSAIQVGIFVFSIVTILLLASYYKIVLPLRQLVKSHQKLIGGPVSVVRGSEIEQLRCALKALEQNLLDGEKLNQVFLGHYKVIDVIGKGSMGTLFRAWDPRLQRFVALKTVRFTMDQDQIGKEYQHNDLMQEAVTIAQFTHPNIVTIYDVVEVDGMGCIAMELVDGQSLEAYLQQNIRCTANQVAVLAVSILRALTLAHRRGILHRDVKPANVLLGRDGSIKLTDFGVAQFGQIPMQTSEDEDELIKGTPNFIAPEIWDGEPYSEQSDLFALGVVLYRSLSGMRPFLVEQIPPLNLRQDLQKIPPLDRFDKNVPEWLDQLIRNLLQPDCRLRPSSAAKLVSQLQLEFVLSSRRVEPFFKSSNKEKNHDSSIKSDPSTNEIMPTRVLFHRSK